MFDLRQVIGLGVAGNFAKHLEQAGELEDFKEVQTETPDAPKGIFPFYLPGSETFLGIYPYSDERLNLPPYEANAQVEPEIAVLFDIVYDDKHQVVDLHAKAFTVFNDCTIRKEGAKKISEKKSWGSASKGIARRWVRIDRFAPGGVMDRYRLCSFLKRDGVVHSYGVDAPLVGYSYFHERLKRWLIGKINTQKDFGPLEDIAAHLKSCDYPSSALISIGATAYTAYGESHYLQSGDEVYVVAYDAETARGTIEEGEGKIVLRQKVF